MRKKHKTYLIENTNPGLFDKSLAQALISIQNSTTKSVNDIKYQLDNGLRSALIIYTES